MGSKLISLNLQNLKKGQKGCWTQNHMLEQYQLSYVKEHKLARMVINNQQLSTEQTHMIHQNQLEYNTKQCNKHHENSKWHV